MKLDSHPTSATGMRSYDWNAFCFEELASELYILLSDIPILRLNDGTPAKELCLESSSVTATPHDLIDKHFHSMNPKTCA